MFGDLENAYIRRFLSLGMAILNHKVLTPSTEWETVATDDAVLETAKAFDDWVRNGRT